MVVDMVFVEMETEIRWSKLEGWYKETPSERLKERLEQYKQLHRYVVMSHPTVDDVLKKCSEMGDEMMSFRSYLKMRINTYGQA